jgi:hypothetical protein
MAILPYAYVDVKDWLVQRLKTLLHDAGYVDKTEIRVLKSDPHDATDIPCVCVNLANADETNSMLGDFAGSEVDPTLNSGAGGVRRFYGTFMAETMELRVWDLNLDERDALRVFLTAQLFGLRREMLDLGIRQMRISGGRDEQDNVTLQPHPLYWAPFNISYLNPIEVYEDDALISDITVTSTVTS